MLDKIGRYEIKRRLGLGGMATVYLAHDPNFDTEVAVKLLPRQPAHGDNNALARFEREAKTIASLREHPAIVSVYDYGTQNEQPYFVMRHLRGGSLADKLDTGVLSPVEITKITERIASALDTAHKRGIIHRDLKPANVLFDEEENAYLSDFGIAKLSESNANYTGSAIIGTPTYMSPEQARGNVPLDARSDVYALGVLIYEMLTGVPPFSAETAMGVALQHISDPAPDIRNVRPDLPAAFSTLLNKALAKDPNDRFATAGQLAAALIAATRQITAPDTVILPQAAISAVAPVSQPAEPSPVFAPPDEVSPSSNRRGLGVMLLLLACMLLVGGFVWGRGQQGSAEPTLVIPTRSNLASVLDPTNTPTLTATQISTPTGTATATPSPTATQPQTPTVTATSTRLPTLTPTETQVVVLPPTAVTTPTATPPPSVTPTNLPTLKPTLTPTLQPSATPQPTVTPLPTATPIPTNTPLPPTPTATATLIPSATPTRFPTATSTPVPTATPTVVTATDATINAFTASTFSATLGDTITLNWDVSGVDTVNLIRNVGGRLTNETVAAQNSQTITIVDSDLDANVLLFELQTNSASNTLTISLECPFEWFFSPDTVVGSANCPSQPLISAGSTQRFQNGTFIWVAQLDQIWVHLNGGTSQKLTDDWEEGMDDVCPDLTAPFKPTRGFGLVWCNNPAIRTALGNPIADAGSYTTVWQRTRPVAAGTQYLRLRNGNVLQIPAGNSPNWIELTDVNGFHSNGIR